VVDSRQNSYQIPSLAQHTEPPFHELRKVYARQTLISYRITHAVAYRSIREHKNWRWSHACPLPRLNRTKSEGMLAYDAMKLTETLSKTFDGKFASWVGGKESSTCGSIEITVKQSACWMKSCLPRWPAMDDAVRILPPRPWAIIMRAAALMQKCAARTFTFKMRSRSSAEASSTN